MQSNIIIAGAGATGLTLALLFAHAGISVDLICPQTPESNSADLHKGCEKGTHTTALMEQSIHILHDAGVMSDLEDSSGQLYKIKILDLTGTRQEPFARVPSETEFDCLEIGKKRFGLNVPLGLLQESLLRRACAHKNICFHAGETLSDFATDLYGVTVFLKSRKTLRGKLLVGADGRNSCVRDKAKIEALRRDYRQQAMTFLVSHTLPHKKTSYELYYPGGPLTFVPLPDLQDGSPCSAVVWVEDKGRAHELSHLAEEDFESLLQQLSGDILGRLNVRSKINHTPLSLLMAKKIVCHRVALVGEAAHVLHPMGAQGLNLSLRDVKTLAEYIKRQISLGLDPGSKTILEDYERSRKKDIAFRLASTHLMARALNHKVQPLHHLRRKALEAAISVPGLKSVLMSTFMTGETSGG